MIGRYLHLPSDGGEPEMLAVFDDMDSLLADIEANDDRAQWVQIYTEPTTQTPRDAAKYVRRFLEQQQAGDGRLTVGLIDLAGIAVYHLVENACKHGNPAIRTTVIVDADGIRIEVHDHGHATGFGPDGFGLTIVRAIAGDIQVLPEITGKTVTTVVPYERKR